MFVHGSLQSGGKFPQVLNGQVAAFTGAKLVPRSAANVNVSPSLICEQAISTGVVITEDTNYVSGRDGTLDISQIFAPTHYGI